jgi:hypothetical protein
MANGNISLPNDASYLGDFKMVRKRVTQSGLHIALVGTPDGRHADYCPATVRALRRWINDEEGAVPEKGTPEYDDYMDDKKADEECGESDKPKDWWEKT